MSFSPFSLDDRLMQAIKSAGYTAPTPIQEAAIPPALAGHDLIGTAQTGTGKTAAFVLPMLQALMKTARTSQPRALILTPTRELAEQIHENIRLLGARTGLRSATVYGGVGMAQQERALRGGADIIVACPGRLIDHMDRGNARLDGIKLLVLDEADRMFDMGFLPSIRRILKKVPRERQTMLFSATFPREIEELAADTLVNPKRIAIGRANAAHTVDHALYPVPRHLKSDLLLDLLGRHETKSVLIFTRTKHGASRLARRFDRNKYKATSLHGDRSQSQRREAIEGFMRGSYKIMVATDIAARGLDIETISHVINYDIPETPDAYIHRIGRTGRAERNGFAFTLVTPEEYGIVRDIERSLGSKIRREFVDEFNYDADAPPRETHPRSSQPQPRSYPRSAPLHRGGRSDSRSNGGDRSRRSSW